MNKWRYLFIGLLFVVFSAVAQDSILNFTYKTYSMRDFSGWPVMIEKLQKEALSHTGTKEQQLQLMVDYYGYVGHLLDVNKKNEAAVWAKKGSEALKQVKKNYPKDATVIALESMFIAYQIALNPMKAPFQAGGMMSTAKEALKMDPNLYLANIANANILFYFPSALGGDKHKAIEYYKKAYNYFVQHPQIAKNSWVYLNVMSTLGVANEAVGNKAEALRWCNQALKICPDFVYVKTILLPRMEKN